MNAPLSRRARILGILLLASTFAAGSLAGAASTRVLSAREPGPAAGKDRDCEGGRHRGKGMIFDRIGLSPEQRARIDTIMKRGRARTDSLWRTDTRYQAAVDSTRAAVRAVMTPAQRAEFDRLRAERDAQRRERHGKDGDGPPKHGG
ncbi:MAG TPA: hypothetical protein VFQ45_11885 [Longimicrobium sp.]|nr:hypothetical protein [Longimicrobium sp.]